MPFTQEQLKLLVHYDPDTGVFTKLANGRIATVKAFKGYSAVRILGKRYLAHRLAWFYIHGCWPDEDTDHHNGVRNDNRLCNISARSYCQNQQNRGGAQKNNKLGVLGVRMVSFGKYQAQIRCDKKYYNLGFFTSIDEASSAYMAAKQRLHLHSPRLLPQRL